MKRNKKNKFFLLFLLLLFFVLGASFVLAQEKELEVGQYPIVPGAEAPTSTRAFLPDYAKYVLNFALSLVGLFIFGVLVYGGFLYLTSAGSPIKLETAKKQVLAAFLGLIIILCSYLILHTINPQLVIFRVPEWIKVELSPFIKTPPPLDEQTLYAKEIPIGTMIDGLQKTAEGEITYEGALTKTRLDRIKDVLKNIIELSEDLEEKAGELASLAPQCACGLAQAQCAGPCSGGYCSGDPCPAKNLINEKRGGIQDLLNGAEREIDGKKEWVEGLKYWQSKLDEELNGPTGLKQALKELEDAEQKMKVCPSSFSEQGKTQALLNLDNFWRYKEGLEKLEIVKKVEAQPIWENIYAGDDDFTFYCSEVPFEVSLEEGEISEEIVEEAISKIETTEPTKVFCEMEIPVGETIDDAESLLKKLISETENINNDTLKEISVAENLIALADPTPCVASNCSTACIWVPQTCCEPCPPEEEPPPPEEGQLPGEIFWFLKPPIAFAQECCYDCSYCDILPCSGSICPGDSPKLNQINSNFAEIQSSFSQLNSSYDIIKKITEEEKLENEPTVNTVFQKLKTSRTEFSKCSNDAEDWTRALFGEKILGKQILTCEDAKNVCWDFEEDYQCYGEGDPEAYTNYFCGEIETK